MNKLISFVFISVVMTSAAAAPAPENVQACKAIEARLKAIDEAQRRALPATEMDRLNAERKAVRDKQFELKC